MPAVVRLGSLLAIVILASPAAQAETLLERGSYLVNTILACGNCHTPKSAEGNPIRDREFAGGLSFTTPAFNATAANITPDKETGIGAWSDDEIKTALVAGSRPDHARLPGTPLAAVMPANFYKALLPRDLDAVVAYLRSVKPVRNEVPWPEYKAPVHRDPYPDAEQGFTEADLANPARRGAYLATIGHCMECHSTFVRGASDYVGGLGKGGRPFGPSLVQGIASDWQGSQAPNITPDRQVGIGAHTDAEIKRAITRGVARDGRRLKPPMAFAWYAGLTDEDQTALVAWLRSLPGPN